MNKKELVSLLKDNCESLFTPTNLRKKFFVFWERHKERAMNKAKVYSNQKSDSEGYGVEEGMVNGMTKGYSFPKEQEYEYDDGTESQICTSGDYEPQPDNNAIEISEDQKFQEKVNTKINILVHDLLHEDSETKRERERQAEIEVNRMIAGAEIC